MLDKADSAGSRSTVFVNLACHRLPDLGASDEISRSNDDTAVKHLNSVTDELGARAPFGAGDRPVRPASAPTAIKDTINGVPLYEDGHALLRRTRRRSSGPGSPPSSRRSWRAHRAVPDAGPSVRMTRRSPPAPWCSLGVWALAWVASAPTAPSTCSRSRASPFIVHQLRWLASHGVRDVVLATSFLADQFEPVLGDGSRWGLRLRYSTETVPEGTGGGLALGGAGLRGAAGAPGRRQRRPPHRATTSPRQLAMGVGRPAARSRPPPAHGARPPSLRQRRRRRPGTGHRLRGEVGATAPSNEVNAGTYVLSRASRRRHTRQVWSPSRRTSCPSVVAQGPRRSPIANRPSGRTSARLPPSSGRPVRWWRRLASPSASMPAPSSRRTRLSRTARRSAGARASVPAAEVIGSVVMKGLASVSVRAS